jgi:hypothetical protein
MQHTVTLEGDSAQIVCPVTHRSDDLPSPSEFGFRCPGCGRPLRPLELADATGRSWMDAHPRASIHDVMAHVDAVIGALRGLGVRVGRSRIGVSA